jgi:hypothetical protein
MTDHNYELRSLASATRGPDALDSCNRGQMARLNGRNLLHPKVESKFVLQIISTMNLLSVNDSYFSYSVFSIFPDTITTK